MCHAAAPQAVGDPDPARAVPRGKCEVDVTRALPRNWPGEPRLEHVIDAVEGDEAAIVSGR